MRPWWVPLMCRNIGECAAPLIEQGQVALGANAVQSLYSRDGGDCPLSNHTSPLK